MKEYGLKALRDQVTGGLQKNILFSGTIRDNLRWGNKNAAGREICDAAELANAGQFIEMLPEGYDTMLTGRPREPDKGEGNVLPAVYRRIGAGVGEKV